MNEKIADIKLGEISKILAEMVKTVKIVSIYPDNNPLPVKLKESFIDRFIDLIRDYGELRFKIQRNKIFYGEDVVFSDKPDSEEESLAELLFNNGVKELIFQRSFGSIEADLFFKVMKTFLNREEGSRDLVGLFWQENIDGFEYKIVEDYELKEYEGEFLVHETIGEDDDEWFMRRGDTENDEDRIEYADIFLDEADENTAEGDGRAELKAGLNPTPRKERQLVRETALILNDAYSLEENELEQTKKILTEDDKFDMYESTTELLIEMLSQEDEYPGFAETVTIIEKINNQFLHAGGVEHSTRLLEALNQFGNTISENRPRWKERIQSALIMSGGYEGMTQFAESLNSDSSIGTDLIHSYLSHFSWEAISSIVDLLGILEHKDHRLAVCSFLADRGREHVDIISKGIFDKRWFVVRNTVAILVGIGGNKASSYLERAVSHDEPRVRENLAKSLKDHKNPENLKLLVKLVFDKKKQVRRTALEAIFEYDRENLINAIVDTINDQRFFELKDTEWGKILLKYSELSGDSAMEYLAGIISDWRVFPDREELMRRKAVFEALAVNSSKKADDLLRKLSKSWRPSTKKAAREAIAKRNRNFGN